MVLSFYLEIIKKNKMRKTKNQQSAKNFPYWKNLKNVRFVWHGINVEPELLYKGYLYNYWDIVILLTEWCKDYYKEQNMNIGGIIKDSPYFDMWLKENKDKVKEAFETY